LLLLLPRQHHNLNLQHHLRQCRLLRPR
jgi:hypothetical protein